MTTPLDYLPRMPKDRSVGIGCVGAGFIMADCHLVAYRQAGFNPVALASRTPDRARAVADRHGIDRVYNNVDQLLGDPRVEIVDVAVPPDAQIDVIRAIVNHRRKPRAVLAQKPLGVDYVQACEIVRLCESAGVLLA